MTKAHGFLNVDLEVGARNRAVLAPLIEEVEHTLLELYRGRIRRLYRAHYETLGCGSDASRTIHALATVIEGLGRSARRAWDAAEVRDFNVGAELDRGVRCIEIAVDGEATRRIAALRGRIVFTAYQMSEIPQSRICERPVNRRQS